MPIRDSVVDLYYEDGNASKPRVIDFDSDFKPSHDPCDDYPVWIEQKPI
jgi:hypothetical protein